MFSLWSWIITSYALHSILTTEVVAKFTLFYVNPDITDVTCLAEHVLFTTRSDVGGSLLCVLRCHNETGCWSVFHSTDDLLCVGCSMKYDNDSGLPAEQGTQYIVGQTQTSEETVFDPNLYHSEGRMTFYEGVDVCVAGGGHMLQVDTAEENQFIAQLFPDINVMWIGLTDERVEGVWEWYNYTSTTGYTNWKDNFLWLELRPEENCAVILKIREYTWRDRDTRAEIEIEIVNKEIPLSVNLSLNSEIHY